MSSSVPLNVKWSKRTFSADDHPSLVLRAGLTTDEFKSSVLAVTGVPPSRQKLLCKSLWRGTLPDGHEFVLPGERGGDVREGTTAAVVTLPEPRKLAKVQSKGPPTVILIGSAETIPSAPPPPASSAGSTSGTDGVKDSPDEKAEGMIVAIQYPPEHRDDGRTNDWESHRYSGLASGMGQRPMEEVLRRRRAQVDKEEREGLRAERGRPTHTPLAGKVAMTLGLELRRAYVNALAVLPDGTLISGADDGHVRFWRHAEQVHDAVHDGVPGVGGGVECMVSLGQGLEGEGAAQSDAPALATGGAGVIWAWTEDAERLASVPCPAGTTPASLASARLPSSSAANHPSTLVLAAALRSALAPPDPNRYRLVPQDEAGRRRREAEQARERAARESVDMACGGVEIVMFDARGAGRTTLRPPDRLAPAVTSVEFLPNTGINDYESVTARLVCADMVGGIRVWGGRGRESGVDWMQEDFLQLRPPSPDRIVSVVCMEPLTSSSGQRLAVSTEGMSSEEGGDASRLLLPGAATVSVSQDRAVFLVDLAHRSILAVINTHADVVQCMCALPDGGLATGGGKHDATTRVWAESQLDVNVRGSSSDREGSSDTNEDVGTALQVLGKGKILEDVGYVFALAVLPDEKPESRHWALAAVRYNVVKVCL